MTERVRAADDIEAINKRIEELRKEREAALNKPPDDLPVPAVQTSLEWGMYLTNPLSTQWMGYDMRHLDPLTVVLTKYQPLEPIQIATQELRELGDLMATILCGPIT